MLRSTSKINKFTIQIDCMRTSPIFPTISRGPTLSKREFCTAEGTTLKNLPLRLWTLPCPNFFHRENENAQ